MSKWVLVEAVQSFRMRYMVEVADTDPAEYALDTVVLEKAVEFSQEWIGEQIVSHRTIALDEAISLCREDNHLYTTDKDKLIDSFFTRLDDTNK